jgi:23S rRNA (uracil1939-C5)-methyltransferase
MEVRIEKLVYGGDGLAHHDGQTVFVPLVLPGELVRIESAARKKKFVRGRLEQVVEASPERVPPRARTLGAAAAASTSTCRTKRSSATKRKFCARRSDASAASSGRARSRRILRRHSAIAIERNGSCARNRRARPGSAGIGYFEAGSTRLCAVDECAILSPRLAETFPNCARSSAQSKILSDIDEVEAFADSAMKRFCSIFPRKR